MRKLLFFLVLIVIGISALWLIIRNQETMRMSPTQNGEHTQQNDITPTGKKPGIEVYIRSNISDLSPVKEQVGGTFYVTGLQAGSNSGTVSYEDGHNAYTADFLYTMNEQGDITVTSFTIRE